jgi:succinate dehydrogenase/fumarate reductase flavoprotein subunit
MMMKSGPVCNECVRGHAVAATITPSIHYTMGGLEINENAQILREHDGKYADSTSGLPR